MVPSAAVTGPATAVQVCSASVDCSRSNVDRSAPLASVTVECRTVLSPTVNGVRSATMATFGVGAVSVMILEDDRTTFPVVDVAVRPSVAVPTIPASHRTATVAVPSPLRPQFRSTLHDQRATGSPMGNPLVVPVKLAARPAVTALAPSMPAAGPAVGATIGVAAEVQVAFCRSAWVTVRCRPNDDP